MDIDILGIDLAKRVFQLHGADRRGHALYGAKVVRAELLSAVHKLGPRVIAMEACSSAHYWTRLQPSYRFTQAPFRMGRADFVRRFFNRARPGCREQFLPRCQFMKHSG